MRRCWLGLLLLTGCSFDPNGFDLRVADGGPPTDGAMVIDGAPVDGPVPSDGAPPDAPMIDARLIDGAPVCTPAALRCSAGGQLETCRGDGSGFDTTTCTLGCNMTPTPHCNLFYPQPPVARGDLDPSGLTAGMSVPVGAVFNTTNGQITYGPISMTMTLRGPNADPMLREIVGGIAFHHVANGAGPRLAIWSFAGVTFPEGASASANQYRFIGPNAPVLVSTADLTVNGELELTCIANVFVGYGLQAAGSGGSAGAPTTGGNGSGAGGGTTGFSQSGGAGAGHAAPGGAGGNHGGDVGGSAGPMYGGASLSPLTGGSGGGAGGDGVGNGGGGGGAIQLVAGGTLTVGGGVAQRGGVNAGGCGGRYGGVLGVGGGGGGGGGSGGAILLEAPTILLAVRATLAANGGGGGGADTVDTATGYGATGGFDGARTAAGQAGAGAGDGGRGGAAGNLAGETGKNGNDGGGGGGGAAGRIRLQSRTGAATIDGSAILSPRLSDNAATQGSIDIH